MPKKTRNQNTRLSENEREFLSNVASILGTDPSDVLRRMISEWQRYGVSGTAESLRICADGTDKKTRDQNTRLNENERAFLDNVASILRTDRSDVLRRMISEWQRYGVSGTAESLRICAGGPDQLRQSVLRHPRGSPAIDGDQRA